MIITAKQPQLKLRNWEQLYDLWSGYNCRYRRIEHENYEEMRSPENLKKFWTTAVTAGLDNDEDTKKEFEDNWNQIYSGNIFSPHYKPDWNAQPFTIIINTANNGKVKETLEKLIKDNEEKRHKQYEENEERRKNTESSKTKHSATYP